MLPVALGAAAALMAIVALLLYAAGRARARALADDVRAQIEPYLRRKAAELGLPGDAPTWTSRATPEEIVTYASKLAGRLLDAERAGPPATSTKELALAQTQRVEDSDELVVDTGRTTQPRRRP